MAVVGRISNKRLKSWLQCCGAADTSPLLVISSDMNHYAPDAENRRRDRIALDAMATCDPEHLLKTCREKDITMCGVIPAALVMETLRQLGKDFKFRSWIMAPMATYRVKVAGRGLCRRVAGRKVMIASASFDRTILSRFRK